MPTSDPIGRPRSGFPPSEQRNLEYLKGMAAAPMGWPAVPPNNTVIDPAELHQMLDRNADPVLSAPKPWYARPQTYLALLLFGALIVIIVWLI